MKKIILSAALAIAATVGASALPISGSQAAKIANNFIKGRPAMYAASAMTMTSQNTDVQPYYIFNIGDNEGFVIVAGDDAVSPIIAYSYTGSFKTEGMPENLKSTMQKYTDILTAIQKSNIPARALVRKSGESLEKIKPMLRSKWNQDAPFNNDCPDFGKGKCYAGCVPVAMSQMMNYHQWPQKAVGKIPGYKYEDSEYASAPTRKINSLPGTTFDWASASLEQIGNPDFDKAVAEIIRYAGQSINVFYGNDATGGFSSNMLDGLVKYFDYNDYITIVYHNDFKPEEEDKWRNLIYNELKNKRPVIIEGAADSGPGHEFVCDGYENGKYHINWGWGGFCNGYFELDNLAPDDAGIGGTIGNYSFAYGVVLNAQPKAHSFMVYSDRVTVNLGQAQPLDLMFNCGNSDYTSVQFDVSLPKGIMLVEGSNGLPKMTLNVTDDHTVECNRLSNGDYRFLITSPTNSPLKLTDNKLLTLEMASSADALINSNTFVTTKNGVVCNTSYKGFDFYPYNISLLLPLAEGIGDADADGYIDEYDLDALRNVVNTTSLKGIDKKLADMDQDGEIDIADYLLLMDKLRKEANQEIFFEPTLNEGIISMGTYINPLNEGDTELAIFPTLSNIPTAKGIQFTMKFNKNVSIKNIWTGVDERTNFDSSWAQYLYLGNNKYRLSVYFTDGRNIGAHDNIINGLLLKAVKDLKVEYSDIVLVTSDLKKISVKENNVIYDAIDNVIVPEEQVYDNRTYTLEGVQINDTDNLPAGVYIRNGKKVIVK